MSVHLISNILRLQYDVAGLGGVHGEVHGALLLVKGEAPQVERAAVLGVDLPGDDQGVLRPRIDLVCNQKKGN